MPKTFFEELLGSAAKHGQSVRLEDIERKPIGLKDLILRSFILGQLIEPQTHPKENVGILLPGTLAAVTLLTALHAQGRVAALLNFTAGLAGMSAACDAAALRVVYTSRLFIQKAGLEEIAQELAQKVQIIYLEDLRKELTLIHKLKGMWRALFPFHSYQKTSHGTQPNDPAIILFTSGTEGQPKGVVLSHDNIVSNCQQSLQRIEIKPGDLLFNSLPLFHSFGLTAATLLPLVAGANVFFYPSPLHYKEIVHLVKDTQATIMLGTNTFLRAYANYATAEDFESVRLVVAGGEKLQESTAKTWKEKYGLDIMEGYGCTETAPVLSVNTPSEQKLGSVGKFLPDIEFHLEPVPNVKAGGRLYVRGPNVMIGYLYQDDPGQVRQPKTMLGDDWHDTGDIVEIDEDGFIWIKGRAKRFAKIGGEMISLAVTEQLAYEAWPDVLSTCVSIPDELRGEQLVLITQQFSAKREEILIKAQEKGLSEIYVPKKIIGLSEFPLLGTGKIDLNAVQDLVNDKLREKL